MATVVHRQRDDTGVEFFKELYRGIQQRKAEAREAKEYQRRLDEQRKYFEDILRPKQLEDKIDFLKAEKEAQLGVLRDKELLDLKLEQGITKAIKDRTKQQRDIDARKEAAKLKADAALRAAEKLAKAKETRYEEVDQNKFLEWFNEESQRLSSASAGIKEQFVKTAQLRANALGLPYTVGLKEGAYFGLGKSSFTLTDEGGEDVSSKATKNIKGTIDDPYNINWD